MFFTFTFTYWFYVENSKSQKKTLSGFSQRLGQTYIYML